MVDIQITPLILPFIVSAVVTLALTVYGVYQLRTDGWDVTTVTFVGIVLSISIWTISRVFELLFVSETLTRLWISVLYIGFGGSTMCVLMFALAFTGRKDLLTRRNVVLLFVFPAIAVVGSATNELHGLMWVGEFVEMSGWYGTIWVYEREFEILFMIYLLYTAGSVLIGIYLLLRMAIGSPDIYRRQTIAFAVGSLTALVLAMFFVAGSQPFMPDFLDLTPVGFAVMGLCFGYAIFRYQMLDLVPVARDTVIESMRDGYIVIDSDQRIVDFNNAAGEMLTTDDSAVGKSVHDIFPAARSAIEDHEPGTRTESEIDLEIDGSQHFLVVNVSSLFEGESLIGKLLLMRDVTDQRAVRKRYQALIENSSDLTLVVADNLQVTYASPSVKNITGVDPRTVEHENALQLVHPEDREAFEELYEQLLANPDETIRHEYRTLDVDGNLLYMEASIRNLFDNPFVEGLVINAREITERKKREQELEAANEELEAANAQLEQFASVISHDLRNPINVARGHLDLARETGREESFEKISDSLQRMEAIINDVLTLAREGESIGETEPVELEERAKTAWEHVATDSAELVVDKSDSFQADPDRLLQMLENLFRNAHEHVGEAVTVTVGVENGSLFVEDDGPGIPENNRETVLESGHTTNQDGTGLGLSIVSQIADAHGWDVRVTEGRAGGARFEFPGLERESA